MRLLGAAGLFVSLAMVTLIAAGCGSAPDTKVVIIGIDGMDWQLADPLIEEGKMPNLARIISEGSRSDFHSLMPLEKSPAIWTTLATGKGLQKHGIGGFVEGSEEQSLLNSSGWRARSIWDILGEKGYSIGLVGWLVTWPAKEVNGYCVTERITYSPEDGYPSIPDLTYPPELEEELVPLRASLSGTSNDDIAGLMGGDLWRGGEETRTWGGVQTIKSIFSSDQTIRRISQHLLGTREQPDFYAVYFLGPDRACHRFWGPMRPWTVDMKMDEEVIEAFRGIVPGYYERVDALIGEILDSIDENSTVIVCSDHGFRGPLRTREGIQLGILMHRDVGMLAARGPGIRKGAVLTSASVLDLTPTVLALLGEPVGRDMDGFVLTELIDEQFLADRPVTYIETYEKEGEPGQSEEPIESELDDAIKEELRSLGYIE
ncbi:MAG: alkaline phosphatase family protein [Candidatus Eisenbacteria bacterium]